MSIKKITLTDQQYKTLQESHDENEAIGHVLGIAISEAARQYAKSKRLFWDAVRQMIGAAPGDHMSINWLERCIEIDDAGEEPT